jgi:hypothetical protein
MANSINNLEMVESINLLHTRLSQLEALAPASSWKFWKGASNEEIDFINKIEERLKSLEYIQETFNLRNINSCKDDIVVLLALYKNLKDRTLAIEKALNFSQAQNPQPPAQVTPSAVVVQPIQPPPPPPPPVYPPPPPPPPEYPPPPPVYPPPPQPQWQNPEPPSAPPAMPTVPEIPDGVPTASERLQAIHAKYSIFAREAVRVGLA